MSWVTGVYYGAYPSDEAGETRSHRICIAVYRSTYGLSDEFLKTISESWREAKTCLKGSLEPSSSARHIPTIPWKNKKCFLIWIQIYSKPAAPRGAYKCQHLDVGTIKIEHTGLPWRHLGKGVRCEPRSSLSFSDIAGDLPLHSTEWRWAGAGPWGLHLYVSHGADQYQRGLDLRHILNHRLLRTTAWELHHQGWWM